MRWFSQEHLPGLLVGIAVTAAGCLLHATGVSNRLEMRALDFHFKKFNHIDASDRILHVDITNEAIDRWGRWPWPRDSLADLIDVLNECGARIIALDLILPEPEQEQYRDPARNPYADLIGAVETMGTPSATNWVETDKMLAAAIRRAGSVFIGVDYPVPWQSDRFTPTQRFQEALQAEMAPLLRENFELDAAAIAERLGGGRATARSGAKASLDEIREALPSVQRRVAIERVNALCAEYPGITYNEIHDRILSTPLSARNANTKDLVSAYARFHGVRAALAHCPPVPKTLQGRIPSIQSFTPPWYAFGAAVRGIGAVVFDRNQIGGVVREQHLMVDYKGHLIKQMGFSVVCDYLGIRDDEMSIDEVGDLVIAGRGDRPTFRIQLNRKGAMLVNWHNAPRWEDSFAPHLPVEKVLEIVSLRRNRKENGQRIEILRGDVAGGFLTGEEKLKYHRFEKAVVDQRLRLRRRELDGGDAAAIAEARTGLEKAIQARDAMDQELAAFIKANEAALAGEKPQNEDERKEFARIRRAYAQVFTEIPRLEAANNKIVADIEASKARLIQEVRGKICVLGYTATAVADFMVTPLFTHTPGSMMHTNIINNFLQNRFVRQIRDRDWWKVTALIGLAGLATAWVTLRVGPVSSLTFVLALMMTYFSVHAWIVWGRGHLYVAVVMPIATIFVTWAFVTLYRQLTEERSKRHVAKVLGQYTSPAIAHTIVEATTDLSPQEGVVTCFFSDLQGFTTLSEKLGAERTKAILNPYLEVMSAVLIDRGAMINKFIGDAVFAFFNPPLFACPAHAQAACEAALDSMAALARLKTGEQYPELKVDLQQLFMRIGINSGPVFVGDYGSENKLDYTCIGDTVNLAARLEPANKVFATWVMISERTYAAVNGGFEVRHLGGLQVKGKAEAIQVYELLGRPGEVDDASRRYAERFGVAVARFQRRNFSEAETAFRACLEVCPGDAGASRYLTTIARYQTAPPPDDWNGAIELTEK